MENLVNYKEIENAIIELRGLRVILDADVARLYGVAHTVKRKKN